MAETKLMGSFFIGHIRDQGEGKNPWEEIG